MGLLDFLYPKYCVGCRTFGTYLCPSCFAKVQFITVSICVVCNKGSMDGKTHPNCRGRYTLDGAFASLAYAGVVKKLVYTFKYKPFVTDLRRTLEDFFYEGLIQNEVFMKIHAKDAILVPIPLHKDKLRSRGYNQAALLAEDIGKRLELQVADILLRQKKTSSQFKLTRSERQENIKDAFAVKPKIDMKGKTVFLVDDLYTSGTTLAEAANVLKRNGAKEVWGITLAHGH